MFFTPNFVPKIIVYSKIEISQKPGATSLERRSDQSVLVDLMTLIAHPLLHRPLAPKKVH